MVINQTLIYETLTGMSFVMANKITFFNYLFDNRNHNDKIEEQYFLKNNEKFRVFIDSILKNLIIYMHKIYVVSNVKSFRKEVCLN